MFWVGRYDGVLYVILLFICRRGSPLVSCHANLRGTPDCDLTIRTNGKNTR